MPALARTAATRAMALAPASRRPAPERAGFAPGWAYAEGPCWPGAGGDTGEYGGYCGCAWVWACSYHSGAVCTEPPSGGGDGGCCVIEISLSR